GEGQLLFHLDRNRFGKDGDEVNDITREYVYPRGRSVPGEITTGEVRTLGANGRTLPTTVTDAPGLPPGTVLAVELEPPLAPHATVTLSIPFTTRIPKRYGPFGVTEDGLTALGGWHPYLVAHDQ